MIDNFEKSLHAHLHQHLVSIGEVDKQMPDCPDVADKWPSIAEAYIPDGAREFRLYPVASLGWMMYIGMAVAKLWDDEWTIYSQIDDLYLYMRDKRGYDAMDEYIREDVLMVRGEASDALEQVVSDYAARVHHLLMRAAFEPGTQAAFEGYVACLRQLYQFGMAMQLKRMGYRMERIR